MTEWKQFQGFYRLSVEERQKRVADFCHLDSDELALLRGERDVPISLAENFIENVIGYFQIPLGVATNFNVDGRDVLIPMAVEETSIVAAASASAKWVREEGSIRTHTQGSLIIGQIQIPHPRNVDGARKILQENREALMEIANSCVPNLVKRGGGVRDIGVRDIRRSTGRGQMLVVHVLCDPCDAMGANLINQVCEALQAPIEKLTGEEVGLCILSNLVDSKLAVAEVVIRNIDPEMGLGIEEASVFAESDPYRAATHNKGALNGIDPVLIATGNDWRAVEAGVHAYAARTGVYSPITKWRMEGPDLKGRIEVPLAVGTVGGVTRNHPMARLALKILGIQKAEDLARICAAAGLVQNLGALKALSTVGIVKGHMALHTTNLALAAGAEMHEIAAVKSQLAAVLEKEKSINLTKAKEVLEGVRLGSTGLQGL